MITSVHSSCSRSALLQTTLSTSTPASLTRREHRGIQDHTQRYSSSQQTDQKYPTIGKPLDEHIQKTSTCVDKFSQPGRSKPVLYIACSCHIKQLTAKDTTAMFSHNETLCRLDTSSSKFVPSIMYTTGYA